jgi:two-component system NtrC family sensor kinase
MYKFVRTPSWLYLFKPATESSSSGSRYKKMRLNMVVITSIVTILPLLFMFVVNSWQYYKSSKNESLASLKTLEDKTRHSIELFLEERLSTIRFISSAYSYDELCSSDKILRIFSVLRTELGGFIDIGVIDDKGIMTNYAGPYTLLGNDYSEQPSFQKAIMKGQYISDVFMGYRAFPHIVIATHHINESGRSWIIRATIDTSSIDEIIRSMRLDAGSDAFLLNSDGIIQTRTKSYGKILDKCTIEIPHSIDSTNMIENLSASGEDSIFAFTKVKNTDFTLVTIVPRKSLYKEWHSLKFEMLVVFLVSVFFILVTIFKISKILIHQVQIADSKRESAFRELQHSQKLSSIGRLAAGVAHEINNPLAIINEKAGLMSDLIEFEPEFRNREKFMDLTSAISRSVERCRGITHRLLGFAKRIDVKIETLDVNEVIREVVGFVERETIYRKIDLQLNLQQPIHLVLSDHGQLQQVFLNLLTNAIGAVPDEGIITISTKSVEEGGVSITVMDNGCGMSQDTQKRIFDPFFSTKKELGTGRGLSITYGIIKKLGGEIHVESRENEGSSFTVILPKEPQITEEEQ